MAKAQTQAVFNFKVFLFVIFAVLFVIVFTLFIKTEEPPPLPQIPQLQGISVPILPGTISKINALEIEIEVPAILGIQIEATSPLHSRSVRISPSTAIYERALRSLTAYNEDVRRYNQIDPQSYRLPPSRYQNEILTFEDLKVGDTIMVREAADQDLKYKTVISASEILRTSK